MLIKKACWETVDLGVFKCDLGTAKSGIAHIAACHIEH
jgi:hypothetical protein